MTTTQPTDAEPSRNGELYNRVQQLRLDSVAPDAKSTRGGSGSWLPWILCLLMAIAWTGFGIKVYKDPGAVRKLAAPASADANASATKDANATTKTAAADGPKAEPGTVVVPGKGTLIPQQQIAVSPIDVGGRVVELSVVEGKLFKKGDILAKLEDNSYRAQVAESQAGLAGAKRRLEATKQRLAEMDPKSVRKVEIDQAQAMLDEAIASQQRAKNEYDRLASVPKDSGLSIREVQQAEADMRTANARVMQSQAALTILIEGPRKEKLKAAEADVLAAEAEVAAAEARLTQAMWRLDNCTIRSPIDGTVLKKIAELGNLVNPMAFSASTSGGGSVCDIANLADMEVDMDVPERDIAKVFAGQKAKVVADAFKNREYEGVVDRIMPIADDSKSVVKIRVKVILPAGEVPGTYLKPKMSVVCSLLAGENK
jgi:multidrug resistance efflux pump